MKTLATIAALALAATCVCAVPITTINVPLSISAVDLVSADYDQATGIWVIKTRCVWTGFGTNFDDIEGTPPDDFAVGHIRMTAQVTVTPDELAAFLGVPVGQLDNITNKQLKQGVFGSARQQTIAALKTRLAIKD